MMAIHSNVQSPVKLRQMKVSDMDGLMKLKNAEGWNQLEKDWTFLINSRGGINLVASVDDRIVGTVTAINYANTVAWIGMMLVDRNYRGRGISKHLLNEAIQKLNRCASIKLDATPAGKPVYLKRGFHVEHTLYRMTHPSVPKISLNMHIPETAQILPEDLEDVIGYDKKVFGADRTDLIGFMYNSYPELAWLTRESEKIAGFCMGRRGEIFTQIGPVYASSVKSAKVLIQSAINQITHQPVVVDIHGDKSEMKRWLESCGFALLRPFDRMYLNHNPHPGKTENQYLICGPELG